MRFGFIALAAALVAATGQDKEPPPIPGWHPILADGVAEAKASGRPLMVVFR